MGASVSSGQNNDQLVDNLMDLGYVKTKKVEQVLRAVDRGDYVLPSHRENYAYKDLAWKHGHIHLSAPCIYSVVLEALELEPGMSFLNLGSGTGYLNTVAGLLLNQHGTNHGIELHEDCVKYAYERLDEFKQKSQALDKFDFCEPLFVQGNCLSLAPDRQYDRVYCGAACPKAYIEFIKKFVRLGGILIIPFEDELIQMQKDSDSVWCVDPLLPVTFATLVVPTPEEQNLFHLPDCKPLSLQELCRGKIRHRLRENVWHEHPDVETETYIKGPDESHTPQQVLREFRWDYDTASRRRSRVQSSFDAHPGEATITTLQLVRAIIQSNQGANRNDWQEASSNDSSNNQRNADAASDRTEDTKRSKSNRGTRSLPNRRDSTSADSSSDSACEDTRTQPQKQSKKSVGKAKTAKKAYTNISESDSESEQEELHIQRKKVAEREKTDSGMVEDVVLSNEEASSSSNTSRSNSENADPSENADMMDVDLSDITVNESFNYMYNSVPNSSAFSAYTLNEGVVFAHYVDDDAFTAYMKEKIRQLPLPFSLKLYVNYNREL